MSVNSITNWGFNFLVSFTFLTLVGAISPLFDLERGA